MAAAFPESRLVALQFLRGAFLWFDGFNEWKQSRNHDGSNFTEQRIADMSNLLMHYFRTNQGGHATASQPCVLILITKLLQTNHMLMNKCSSLDVVKANLVKHFDTWAGPEWPSLGKGFQEDSAKEWALDFLSCVYDELRRLCPDLMKHPRAKLIISSSNLAMTLKALGRFQSRFLPRALAAFSQAVLQHGNGNPSPFLGDVCGKFGWQELFKPEISKHFTIEAAGSLEQLADFGRLVWQASSGEKRVISLRTELGKNLCNNHGWFNHLQIPNFWEKRMQVLLRFRMQSCWLIDHDLIAKLLRDKVLVRHPDNIGNFSSSAWTQASNDEIEEFFSWVKSYVRYFGVEEPVRSFLKQICEDARNRNSWFDYWQPHEICVDLMRAVLPDEGCNVRDILNLAKQMSASDVRARGGPSGLAAGVGV